MKASELISKLQKAVTEYGDLEILVRDPVDGCDWTGLTVCPDPASSMEKAEGIPGTIDLHIFDESPDTTPAKETYEGIKTNTGNVRDEINKRLDKLNADMKTDMIAPGDQWKINRLSFRIREAVKQSDALCNICVEESRIEKSYIDLLSEIGDLLNLMEHGEDSEQILTNGSLDQFMGLLDSSENAAWAYAYMSLEQMKEIMWRYSY